MKRGDDDGITWHGVGARLNIEHTASLAGLQAPGSLITIRQSMDEGMERPNPMGIGFDKGRD